MSDAVFLGVDIGSLSTDAVAVDGHGRIVGSAILPTGARAALAVRVGGLVVTRWGGA